MSKINKTPVETRLAIERRSAAMLPDRPTQAGLKPWDIRNALFSAIIADKGACLMGEIDRIVDETNAAIDAMRIKSGTLTVPKSHWKGEETPRAECVVGSIYTAGCAVFFMPEDDETKEQARLARLSMAINETVDGEWSDVVVFVGEGGDIPSVDLNFRYVVLPTESEAEAIVALVGVDAYGEGGGGTASGVDEEAVKALISKEVPEWARAKQKPEYTAEEVKARPVTWTPTAAEIGARPSTWMPTAAEVGARPNTWTPTAGEVGAESAGKVKDHNEDSDSHTDIRLDITTLRTMLNTVIGTDTGKSMRAVAALVVAEIVGDASDSFDTLEEIAAWIEAHPNDVAAMVKRITDLETDMGWKVSKTDIINTLDNTALDKPLSAAMGAKLNAMLSEMSDEIDGKTTHDQVAAQIKTALDPYLPKDEAATTYATKDEMASVSLLPYGHSASWLEENGDPAQLYQIDGYIWGYVTGGGWTKSEIQYLVVAAESDMVNEGGTPYLLRKGDEGTVYAYTEANADASIREVDELPESAEGVQDGDLVGYNGGKYQADVTTQSVPAYTNLAKTVVPGYQLGSSGTPKEEAGAAYVEEYIPFHELHTSETPTTVRIRGLGNMTTYNVIGASALDKAASAAAKANNKPAVFSYAYDAGTDTVTLTTVGESDIYWKYLRVVGIPSNGVENVIVTVNEPIENKTVTTVIWNRVGDYNPVFAGWSATEETYPVMDQKDESARHGDEAVYAVDGYLYTYLVNAGWARGGRYDSLLIDSQLSKTSKNAIQNRVVTDELESIKLRADSTDKKLAEVDDKVAAMAGGGGVANIPVVWKEAVEACVASIKSHQEGRHCVTFPFFSDNHQRNGFAGILIAHVMRECGIPYCFFGGDAITSGKASSAVKDGTATVEQEMIAQDEAFDNAMSYIPRGRFCRAVGNHDGYLLPYTDPETNTVYGETVRYDRNRVYELFLRAEGVEQNKHFGGDGTYYYVEDLPSKVRFIVLNTNPATLVGAGAEEIDATQLAWLRNTALHVGADGWGVVIFSHCPISNHYQANVSNAAEVIAAVNACTSADGSDGKPAMIGWFSGHLHRDRIYTGMAVNSTDDSEGDPLGFTQVTITSDANLDYDWLPSGGQPTTRPELTRDMNGDTSHAIDFVTVNTERGEVYITRLGMGEDREYNYKE